MVYYHSKKNIYEEEFGKMVQKRLNYDKSDDLLETCKTLIGDFSCYDLVVDLVL